MFIEIVEAVQTLEINEDELYPDEMSGLCASCISQRDVGDK